MDSTDYRVLHQIAHQGQMKLLLFILLKTKANHKFKILTILEFYSKH